MANSVGFSMHGAESAKVKVTIQPEGWGTVTVNSADGWTDAKFFFASVDAIRSFAEKIMVELQDWELTNAKMVGDKIVLPAADQVPVAAESGYVSGAGDEVQTAVEWELGL